MGAVKEKGTGRDVARKGKGGMPSLHDQSMSVCMLKREGAGPVLFDLGSIAEMW